MIAVRVVLALLLSGCGAAATESPASSIPAAQMVGVADGPVGDFRGVLVQRTTSYGTTFSNDAIPDFDLQRYDTDGAWTPEAPDRITIPEAWAGEPVIFHVRSAWSGHTDDYIELKLYCGAERPIGTDQEDHLVAVVQQATNPASPFVELTTPPLLLDAGTECMVAFKTPHERTLIAYGDATTLFGAYLP